MVKWQSFYPCQFFVVQFVRRDDVKNSLTKSGKRAFRMNLYVCLNKIAHIPIRIVEEYGNVKFPE